MEHDTLDSPEPRVTPNQPIHAGVEGPTAPELTAPRSIALGLTRDYAANWTVPDALRELYQNWKDAILQTHSISLLEFAPRVSATSDAITIVVEGLQPPFGGGGGGPLVRRILGYIRFNKPQGSAEFTNFKSSLDPQCLAIGHSSKKQDERLAGGHGEGLKIAALVLSRAEHHVKISASGTYWNFGFNGHSKSNFYCRLSPAKAKRDPGPASDGILLPRLTAEVGRDVSVLVEKGQKGQRLSLEDFKAWMWDTVDLHAPSSSVRTRVGDLLLGPAHRGRLYLKGLRVPEPSRDEQTFRFGYNLVHGSVDRDRKRLVDASEAIANVHSIWENAITRDEAKALPRYLELLRDHASCADASGAERLVSESTAKKLWAAIRREPSAGGEFYCQTSDQDEDFSVIRSELKKEPRPLAEPLWQILRKYGLVRNPQEELQHRLENSEEVGVPDTPFAHGLVRTLRTLLALAPPTQQTTVVFVRSASDSVDMAYRMEANALYIHEKWLHARGADGPATEGAIRSERDVFLCQHLAEELYRRAVTLIVHKTDGPRTSQTIQPLLQAAHWKLHEMPRQIEVYAAAAAADGTRATQVSFYTGHSLLFTKLCGTQVSYLVVLHGPNCVAQSVDHLLYDPSRDCCLCPRQVVPLSMRRAVFEDPGHGPWVPMVVKMSVRDGLVGAMSSSPGGHHWPLLPKAQDGALVAIAPPSHSPSSETAAPRGTVPVDHLSTASAALDPVLTTPTGASQEDQETIVASQLAAGPLELETGVQTTASDTASDTAAPVPLVPVVESLAPHPDDHPESASGALPSTISRNMTSADRAWWQTWPEPPRDVQTSPSAADHNIGRFQAQESHRSCEPPQGLSKGQYARVQLREPGGDGTTTGRYVLYVHDVLPPTPSHGPGARLVVTKYSFLADRLAWEAGHPDTPAQELLLHFRDADRIGYPDDAEIINVDDVAAVDSVDTEPVGPTVSYVAQVPDPANGLFVRYGIREGSQREWLFLAPLVSSLTGPRGSAAYPRFSPLPVASVFDLSPDDLRLSVGFQKAGYCVQAAVGFAEDRHQAWKTQHPDATVYPGCVASALATMDYDLSTQPDDRGRDVPRIVTISGGGSFAESAAGWLDPSSSGFDGFDGLSGETLSPLQQCELAAQSPGLSPDFIVLTMSRSILTDQSWGSLARTMGLLLEQGYAVALRPVSLPDPGKHGERSVLLLAAPGRTDPQWIDDTLSDLRMVSASDELLERADNEGGVSSVPAADGVAAAGSAGGGDASPPSDSTPRRGDSVLADGAQHIAATVSRIIGEFSTKCALTTNLPRLVVTDNSDGAQDRAKRQRM